MPPSSARWITTPALAQKHEVHVGIVVANEHLGFHPLAPPIRQRACSYTRRDGPKARLSPKDFYRPCLDELLHPAEGTKVDNRPCDGARLIGLKVN